MKKLSTLLSLVALLALPVAAQTNPPPTLGGPFTNVISFLSAGTNYMVAPYAIYDTTRKTFGGGVGIGYKLSEFVVPTLRIDYLDKEIFMPSGSIQLQVPIKLFGKLEVIPFGFTGLAACLSGQGAKNGEAVAIFGAGMAAQVQQHVDLIGDYERWTGAGFDDDQIRFGVVVKF